MDYEISSKDSERIDFEIITFWVFSRKSRKMDEEGHVYLTGYYEHRTAGMSPGGKFARFVCGNTYRFSGYSTSFLSKIEKYKENRKGSKKGDHVNQKGKKGEKMVRIKENVKIKAQMQDLPKLEAISREMRRFLRIRWRRFLVKME